MRPLLQREQLAFRRSTAALAAATKRHRSAPVTHFPGRDYGGMGVTHPRPPFGAAGVTPQAGRRAGRAFSPGAARERGWRGPARGNRTRSAGRGHRPASLTASEMGCLKRFAAMVVKRAAVRVWRCEEGSD